MQGALLERVLRMGLLGCYSLAVILPVRLLLMRCGRKYAYYLWLIVFCNLCVPFSLYSSVSLIPRQVADCSLGYGADSAQKGSAEAPDFAAEDLVQIQVLPEDGTVLSADGTGENTRTDPEETNIPADRAKAELKSMKKNTEVRLMLRRAAEPVWLMGMLGFFLYNLVLVIRLNRRLSESHCTAWDERERIAETDGIAAPFLWGLFRPVIYLPAGMDEKEKGYIIAHEKCHRRRKDHMVKLLVYGVTVFHWFNPFVWLAYSLCCRDMEISCDEEVLDRSEKGIRKAYAESLLKYAARQNGYAMTPLTFGEPSVKTRIRNVLQYKKKGAVVSSLAAMCVIGVAAGLLLRPKEDGRGLPEETKAPADRVWEEPEEKHAEEASDEVRDDSGEEKVSVVNNGGEIIRVDDRLFYMSGQKLYSDGRRLYTSLTEEDGSWAVYACEPDGSGYAKLMDGRIVGWADDWNIPYVWTTAEDADGMEDGIPGRPGIYLLGELGPVPVAYTTEDFLGVDGQYVYFSRREENGIYIDCYWAGDGRMEENVLGSALSAQVITGFYAEGDYLLFAAGEVRESGGFFYGDFYSYNRTPGRLFREHLTDADAFAAADGYIYYQKYSRQEDGPGGLFRVSYDLTGEELVGEALTFLAFDESDGTILAEKTLEHASGIKDLVRINPDGSGERVLLHMEQMPGSICGGDGSPLSGVYLDWELAPGDRIRFSELNLLGDSVCIKAEQRGSREEGAGLEDNLLKEAYLRINPDGSDCRGWNPNEPTQEEDGDDRPDEFEPGDF